MSIFLFFAACGKQTTLPVVPMASIEYSGTILFNNSINKSNIYSISQGESTLKLLWNTGIDLWGSPTYISPMHSFGLYQLSKPGEIKLVNYVNGKVKDLTNTYHGIADEGWFGFSPDEKNLANVNPAGGVQILNIITGETKVLVAGNCEDYSAMLGSGSGIGCLNIGKAVWLNQNTILFENNKDLFSSNFNFPSSITVGESKEATIGFLNEATAVDINGNILFKTSINITPRNTDYYSSTDTITGQEGGDIILFNHHTYDDVLIWFSKSELLNNQGIANQHEIEAPLHPVFTYGGKAEVLSPNGHYLLRFPSEIVDLLTGHIIDLQIADLMKKVINRIIFDNCVWSIDSQQAVCEYQYVTPMSSDEKQQTIGLVFISTIGKPITFSEIKATEDTNLLTWLP
jgi:hypothetical protein